jgi:hypothetical protein
MVLRGPTLIWGMFAIVLMCAVSGYTVLHGAARSRFAVGVYAEPPPGTPEKGVLGAGSAEIQGITRLPLHQAIIVRIEKATAGTSGMAAVALLLSQEGELLFPIQPLVVGRDEAGRLTEQTRFPPLLSIPSQGLLSIVVVRLPAASPAALAELTAALKGGGPVHLTYGRLLSAARGLSGHVEMLTTEVRG